MNTNARTTVRFKGWASAFALAIGLWNSTPAAADPIRFSTSGRFELAAGTGELAGVTDATPADSILIGAVPVDGFTDPLGSTAFHIQFKFNGDLPTIDVSGTATYLAYNPDLPVLDAVVSTSATSAQIGLYPELFQRLIAHPDWLHTTSFLSDHLPTMAIGLSVHPEDPGAIRPVPEPSSLLFVAMAAAGLGWRARRRLRRPAS
ncbi:PEP-CTERM sorting domain-containing protein [Paludisphaera borealis]|uniref:Ice-binding protein C-terminal domain-containing protein n=1 Tax=Paludisphaera borealis TaxID=1387353 RepID=A0A1U7CPC5_9BACT|nr:PEP-CTERM sorting domain-containing protein [Paludisphaera borealis]APW60771.1 hypothetical protein BSF38_02260 [Paludisphaera borealis]